MKVKQGDNVLVTAGKNKGSKGKVMKVMKKNDKIFDPVIENIKRLSGQKPMITKAKKAISNFKLREGMPVGVAVTLRGPRMNDFLTRLVHIVLPRIRDFRGISARGFD